MHVKIFIGLMLPFAGTVLGALCVFFIRKNFKLSYRRFICGFAAGVMIAASVWSLLIPAMEYDSSQVLGIFAFLPATLGVWAGVVFLMLIGKLTDKIDCKLKCNSLLGKAKRSFGDNTMLFLSVTMHNLPEGMAVGVVYAALLTFPSGEAYGGALALSLGIAIQNIPEGAIISMPLSTEGMKKRNAFGFGVASGVIEPIGAILTLMMVPIVLPILPFLLGFAAGAMIYAVVKELMPSISEDQNSEIGPLSFCAGFSLMMILDVVLG